MLPKVEYGHLYKFAVSLGMLLVAIALVIPWLVLRESSVLLVPEADLDALTATGRSAMLRKQRDYEFILGNYRWVSSILLGLGATLCVYGLLQWRKRQPVFDEMENLQVANLSVSTPQEAVDAKRERESNAAFADADADEALAEALSEAIIGPSVGESGTDRAEERAKTRAEAREAIDVVEQLVTEKLREAYSSTHLLHQNVGVRLRNGTEAIVDAVLWPTDYSDPPIAIEVKWARGSKDVRNRIHTAVAQLAQVVGAIENSPAARGLAIVVIEASLPPSTEHRLSEAAQAATDVLAVAVDVYVISMEQLRTATPSQLRYSLDALVTRNDMLRAGR